MAALPIAVVSLKGAKALRRQGPWLYRTELLAPPETEEPGAIVQVVDPQRNPIGQAFYAQRSPLALRLLTRKAPGEERVDDAFFDARLRRAVERRRPLAGRDAMRLVHGESDLLPGLFCDRYGPALSLQTLSEGAQVRKERWAGVLAELTGAEHVVCRDDASGRDFEGLPRETRVLRGAPPEEVIFHEGKNALGVNLLGDMKTGSFLDQLDNHLRAAELGSGEALDCFSYHGGFALALARTCSKVTAVEQDEKAASRIRANVARNGLTNVEVANANAFDVLAEAARAGPGYDTIVIDPPGLAKRKEGLGTALRAYRELNLRGIKALRTDGVLVTCSCSGKLKREDFEEMVFAAAEDAKRSVQVLERRGAGIDHPGLPGVPEAEYLKVLVLRVL